MNDLTNDIFGESGSSGGKSTDPADLEKARKEEKKKWVDVHVTVSVYNSFLKCQLRVSLKTSLQEMQK